MIQRKNKRQPRRPEKPGLRFSPYAWAKLQWFCHHGPTEIGGFGTTAQNDLLLIADFITVKQAVSLVSVNFDDEAVADYFDRQVDEGKKPEQFARIWLHSHPGNCPSPSLTDEETFARVFGSCDWAVMFILAQDGATYARLRFNSGPGGECELPVAVDYGQPFGGSDFQGWEAEYTANVHQEEPVGLMGHALGLGGLDERWLEGYEINDDLLAELTGNEFNEDGEVAL